MVNFNPAVCWTPSLVKDEAENFLQDKIKNAKNYQAGYSLSNVQPESIKKIQALIAEDIKAIQDLVKCTQDFIVSNPISTDISNPIRTDVSNQTTTDQLLRINLISSKLLNFLDYFELEINPQKSAIFATKMGFGGGMMGVSIAAILIKDAPFWDFAPITFVISSMLAGYLAKSLHKGGCSFLKNRSWKDLSNTLNQQKKE